LSTLKQIFIYTSSVISEKRQLEWKLVPFGYLNTGRSLILEELALYPTTKTSHPIISANLMRETGFTK